MVALGPRQKKNIYNANMQSEKSKIDVSVDKPVYNQQQLLDLRSSGGIRCLDSYTTDLLSSLGLLRWQIPKTRGAAMPPPNAVVSHSGHRPAVNQAVVLRSQHHRWDQKQAKS